MISRYGFRGDPRAAAPAGRAVYVVPSGNGDKASILRAFGDALHFPSWYGANYDALADCLRDLSWLPAGPKTIVWDGAAGVRARGPATYQAVRQILTEAERPDLQVVTLLR